MDLRCQKLNYRLHFSLEKVQTVTGVNSNLDDGSHILLWDFDKTPLRIVVDDLTAIQATFKLPTIHLVSTGKVDGYHAYCFKREPLFRARVVLASTPSVDPNFLALGLMRGYFTLRFSEMPGRSFKGIGAIQSGIQPDCSGEDVSSFVNYTKNLKTEAH